MDIIKEIGLYAFIYFFIPGFISVKIYDLIVPGEERDFSKSVYDTLAYGALNFASLSWAYALIYQNKIDSSHPICFYIFLTFALLIVPMLWPLALLKVMSWEPISKIIVHPIKKPWDYVFGKKKSYWVIITLKTGEKIGGRYDTQSFASSYPAEEQIYLEELWKLGSNNEFDKPIERSKGMVISEDNILTMEFFE